MGKKTKVGKSRRDKFYQLAKETGYRARSAFKLIQLNRKFEFLQKSRVVIDLCAAPGGWLQVVAENTPLSSLIIGVDLVPIRGIKNVTTLQEDITTEKCRQALKKEMHTWKADCVLNDGAPNVGKNWVHDAFQQNQLTLQALKLAAQFLKKGGWFVTKVFRSKDYNSLLWVFQQLFKNVHATKPQASRNESAEIFVVCQHFLAPDKLDPKFLDPKFVFKEIEAEPKNALDLMHPEKKKRQRDGYPEGDYTLFHTLNVSDFFQSENYLQMLAEASEVVLDDNEIKNHPSTTEEIKACLTDIKVLGKKEIRMIINWRKKLKKELNPDEGSGNKAKAEDENEDESEDEEEKIKEQLAEMEEDERKALKRKIRKTRKEKSKLQQKMDSKMVIDDEKFDPAHDKELFLLNKIKGKSQLEEIETGDSYLLDADAALDDDEEETDDDVPSERNTVSYDRDNRDYLDPNEMSSDDDYEESDSEISLEEPMDDDNEEEDEEGNPLLVGEPDRQSRMESWFSKDSFLGLETEADEDAELELTEQDYKKKGGEIIERTSEKKEETEKGKNANSDSVVSEADSEASESETDSESEDSDEEEETEEMYMSKKQKKAAKKKADRDSRRDGFEVVSTEEPANLKLNPLGLALGSALVSSRKRRREVIESGYHRYMFNDENLPAWFVKDEAKHQRTNLPVTKGDVEEFKMKMKAVDANPIKKVAEAKARKKRKQIKRLEKARKKAEMINEAQDVTDREKWQQIKQVYKRAGLLSQKKKEVAYVVAKKGTGKRVRRPAGVQGPFKVVDKRLKKDKRGMQKAEKRNAGNKGRGRGKGKGNKRNK